MAPTGYFVFDIVPRIGHLLLQSQADAFLFLVNVQDDDVNVLADFENFGRMADAAPAHVGDMEQAVDAVEVNERAEIGDVLDRAFADVAGRHFGEQLGAFFVALLLDQLAAGEDDVLAVLVDFDDLEFVGVADELLEIFRGGDVNLRRGQKGLDADVDDQAAFDDRFDFAVDAAAFVADGEDVVPVLFELRFFVGEDDGAFLVFELLDEDIDFIADFEAWGPEIPRRG